MTEEMSDSEMWRLYKEHSKEKRSANREAGAQILRKAGINFITKNGGAHLIIARNGIVADFWPGTGKWIIRDGKTGRGVKNLIQAMQPVAQ